MTRTCLTLLLAFAFACGDDDVSPMDLGPGDAGGGTDMRPPDDDMFVPEEDAGPTVSCPDTTSDDTLETATRLMDIASNAGFPVETVMGDIDPITDLDWYRFDVEDSILGDVQPRYALAARPAGVIWELCMYFECGPDADSTSFDCEDGSTPHTAGDIAGCCVVTTEGAASITLSPSCAGTTAEDGTAYARVSRQGGTVACQGYDLSYGDD